jgi:hypothetical protein
MKIQLVCVYEERGLVSLSLEYIEYLTAIFFPSFHVTFKSFTNFN